MECDTGTRSAVELGAVGSHVSDFVAVVFDGGEVEGVEPDTGG